MNEVILISTMLCIAGTANDMELAHIYCPAKNGVSKSIDIGENIKAGLLPSEFGKGYAFRKTRIRFAEKFLKCRKDKMEKAGKILVEMEEIIRSVDKAEDKKRIEIRLKALSGDKLDEAEKEMMEAIECEERRLIMLQKARAQAKINKEEFPKLDEEAVKKLYEMHKSGEIQETVKKYFNGLRQVTKGIISFIEEDIIAAVASMKRATKVCPELTVAYIYLGSFSYLMGRGEAAFIAWWKALKLEPENEEIRKTIEHLGSTGIGPDEEGEQ